MDAGEWDEVVQHKAFCVSAGALEGAKARLNRTGLERPDSEYLCLPITPVYPGCQDAPPTSPQRFVLIKSAALSPSLGPLLGILALSALLTLEAMQELWCVGPRLIIKDQISFRVTIYVEPLLDRFSGHLRHPKVLKTALSVDIGSQSTCADLADIRLSLIVTHHIKLRESPRCNPWENTNQSHVHGDI